MVETWKYYNVDDLNSWKQRQGSGYRGPPKENFLAAANHIRNLLDGKSINWAAIGGLPLLCLGSRREMMDIHIVYEAKEYNRLLRKLEHDQRIRLPKSMNSLFPAKILVQTGPQFKDTCAESRDVEVNLLPPGSLGTPQSESLPKAQVLLRLDIDGKMRTFRGLNMLFLIKTSLQLCRSTDLSWDPRRDIAFLAMYYGKEFEVFRHQLNERELQDFFFSTSYFSKLAPEDQKKCSLALLGREILPTSRSTPPVAGRVPQPPAQITPRDVQNFTIAAEQTARPALMTHKSTPLLNQVSNSTMLGPNPPLPNNMRGALHNRAVSTNSSPMPLSYSGVSMRKPVAPTNASGTVPYARYHAVSAGNTPNQSRNVSRDVSPQMLPVAPARPSSSESRLPSQQFKGPSMAQSSNVPIPPNFSRHNRPTLPQGVEFKQSMPNLNVPGRQPAPIFGPHPGQTRALTSQQNTQPSSFQAAPTGKQIRHNGTPHRWSQEQLYDSHAQPFPNPGNGASQSGGLRLVGPDGLYPSAIKPTGPTSQGPATQLKDGRRSPRLVHSALAAPESAAIFELPAATTPAPTMPQELPAMPVSPITPEAMPHAYQPGDISPLKTPSQANLMTALPASLMIGGRASHQRQRSPQFEAQLPSAQSSAPRQELSNHSQRNQGSTYEAYVGPISPPLQPAGSMTNYAPSAPQGRQYSQTPFPGESKQPDFPLDGAPPATNYVAYTAFPQQQVPILRKPTPDHPEPLKISKGTLPTPPPTAVPDTFAMKETTGHFSSNTQNGEDVLAETMTVVNTQLNAQQQTSYITDYNYFDESAAPYYPSQPVDTPPKEIDIERLDKTMSQMSLSSADPESAYPESEVEIKDAWTQMHQKLTEAATVVTTQAPSASMTKTATALPALSTNSAALLANEYSLYSGVNNIHAMLASPSSPLARQKTFFDGEFEWEEEEDDLSKPYRMATIKRNGTKHRVKVARGKHNFGH